MNIKSLIGKVIQQDGKLYQILSVKNSVIVAHTYGADNGIDETVFISAKTEKIFARKPQRQKEKQ